MVSTAKAMVMVSPLPSPELLPVSAAMMEVIVGEPSLAIIASATFVPLYGEKQRRATGVKINNNASKANISLRKF